MSAPRITRPHHNRGCRCRPCALWINAERMRVLRAGHRKTELSDAINEEKMQAYWNRVRADEPGNVRWPSALSGLVGDTA